MSFATRRALSRRLDGARSATRKELVGGTCATRVTRGTIDFQARFSLRMVMGGVVFSGSLPS